MRINVNDTTINIDDMNDLRDAMTACGDYSTENPTTPLRDNPYFSEAERARKKLHNIAWFCTGCGRAFVHVTMRGTHVHAGGVEHVIDLDMSKRTFERHFEK